MTNLGSLRRQPDGRFALRFERRLRHPVGKVWRALTEQSDLASWFPVHVLEFATAPGARLRFDLTAEAKRRYGIPLDQDTVSEGSITRADPPRLLEYEWAGEVLRWELTPDSSGGCVLVFTDFFDGGDEEEGFPREMAVGWAVSLELLAARLRGIEVEWSVWERAEQLLCRSLPIRPGAAT
jgi:uncharacterized protein YndB with AHSA1/START domain